MEVAKKGVPLGVLLQEPRFEGDDVRMVLTRTDSLEESTTLDITDPNRLADAVSEGLQDVGEAWRARAAGRVEGRVRQATTADELRAAMASGSVGWGWMEPTVQGVRTVDDWGVGEVLGFRAAASEGECIISGKTTRNLALASRRF